MNAPNARCRVHVLQCHLVPPSKPGSRASLGGKCSLSRRKPGVIAAAQRRSDDDLQRYLDRIDSDDGFGELRADQRDSVTFYPPGELTTTSSTRRSRPSDRRRGETLNGYTILRTVGAGSNGTTYEARNPYGELVALKELSLQRMKDWKQLTLFEREARTLRSLQHPGIPRYLDYFEVDTDDNRSFVLVQQLVQGVSLATLIEENWRVTEAEVTSIAKQLLQVLDYLNNLRPPVVHRDIKPENIIIEGGASGGRVFVVDFGGVQAVAADDRMGSTVIGTYGFMAPEQFRGAAQTASDVYSLAATLLYLISGRPPTSFPQDGFQIDISSVAASPQLKSLLEAMLEPHPEDRPTAAQALDILEGRRVALQSTNSSPAGSRSLVQRTGGKLSITIPPSGLSGDTVVGGTFAVVWNAFVAFWTFGALAGGGLLFALFSLPFWAAGVQLVNQFLLRALRSEQIIVGRDKFECRQELALLRKGAPEFSEDGSRGKTIAKGRTRDIRGARVITTIIVNGVPQTAIEIVEGVNKYRLGEGLAREEQEWLASQINDYIANQRGQAVNMSSVPVEEPRVVNSERNDDWGDHRFSRDPFQDRYRNRAEDFYRGRSRNRDGDDW